MATNTFGQQLAHVDKKVRDAAIVSLKTWLDESPEPPTPLHFLKLWKGLYYCFWMSDKRPVQQHLAQNLSQMPLDLSPENAVKFLSAFWTTIVREWSGIDRLRLDKYYMLLNHFYISSLTLIRDSPNPSTVTKEYLSILTSGPLHPSNPQVSDGLRFHLTENFVKSMVDVKLSCQTDLLEPFFDILSNAPDSKRILIDKVCEDVFGRIATLSSSSVDEEDDEEKEKEEKEPVEFDLDLIATRLLTIATASKSDVTRTALKQTLEQFIDAGLGLDLTPLSWNPHGTKTSLKDKLKMLGKKVEIAPDSFLQDESEEEDVLDLNNNEESLDLINDEIPVKSKTKSASKKQKPLGELCQVELPDCEIPDVYPAPTDLSEVPSLPTPSSVEPKMVVEAPVTKTTTKTSKKKKKRAQKTVTAFVAEQQSPPDSTPTLPPLNQEPSPVMSESRISDKEDSLSTDIPTPNSKKRKSVQWKATNQVKRFNKKVALALPFVKLDTPSVSKSPKKSALKKTVGAPA